VRGPLDLAIAVDPVVQLDAVVDQVLERVLAAFDFSILASPVADGLELG
jgi:hypothetical protein